MRIKTLLTTLLVTMMLVIGIDYGAMALNGKSLILGHANYANGPTSITRTGEGAALTVYSRPGRPPIRVNRTVKAPKLNADYVDGKSASAFAPAALAPVAMGFIYANGSIASDRGVATSTWNDTLDRYEIKLSGVAFHYSSYVTQVTAVCDNKTADIASVSGDLLVQFREGGVKGPCDFSFVVYDLP